MADSNGVSLPVDSDKEAQTPAGVQSSPQGSAFYQPVEGEKMASVASPSAGMTPESPKNTLGVKAALMAQKALTPTTPAKRAEEPKSAVSPQLPVLAFAVFIVVLLIVAAVFVFFRFSQSNNSLEEANNLIPSEMAQQEESSTEPVLDELYMSASATKDAYNFSGSSNSGESLSVAVIQSPSVSKTVFTAELSGISLQPNEAYYIWVKNVENPSSEYQQGYVGPAIFEISDSKKTDTLYAQLIVDELIPTDSEIVVSKETTQLPLYPEGEVIISGRAQ